MLEIKFTAPKRAELIERPTPELKENSVRTRTHFTVVSAGTERANLLDLPNTFAYGKWPKTEGYAGVGEVVETGSKVSKVVLGDKVLVYHGTHANESVVSEDRVYKLPSGVKDEEAVLCVVGAMGLGGLRKTALELGESCMIVGLGLLGVFALIGARASGAYPLIAVDLNPKRRALALKLGADYAFDPAEPDFTEKVKEVTFGKGVNAAVEVTGSARALSQTLDCMAFKGRIALNGCTRVSDVPIDFYRQVHCPGITLIGAHNFVRPKTDDYPHYWTNEHDALTLARLIAAGRIDVSDLIGEIRSPRECGEVYRRLCNDKDFPLGVLFDWHKL